MRKLAVGFIVLTLGIFSISKADAEPITEWNYSVKSVFSSWIGSDGNNYYSETLQERTNGKAGFTLGSEGTQLNWYSKDGRNSGAYLTPVQDGTVYTNDPMMVDAFTMTHNNQVVGTDSIKPSFMDIAVTVTLSALNSIGEEFSFDVEMTISLGFLETPNSGIAGYQYTEDDVFFVMDIQSTVKEFTLDGIHYEISLEGSFDELTGKHLDVLNYNMGKNDIYASWYEENKDGPIYGWYTLEKTNEANAMQIGLQVNTVNTPEPATLALFASASLLGIPAYRRWKNRK